MSFSLTTSKVKLMITLHDVRVLLSSSIRGARHWKGAHDPVFFGVFWKNPGPQVTHGVVALKSWSTVPAGQTYVLHGRARPVVFIPPCPVKQFSKIKKNIKDASWYYSSIWKRERINIKKKERNTCEMPILYKNIT